MENTITPERRRILAVKFGLNEQYLYQCLTGRRDMKPGQAMQLEIATEGELKRSALCQGSYREIWPDLAATTEPVARAA